MGKAPKLVELGSIVKPHGYKGAMLARVPSGQQSALAYLSDIHLGTTPDKTNSFRVEEAAWMPKGWKLKLKGVESEASAEAKRSLLVFADRSLLSPCNSGEFYVSDLINAEVLETHTQTVIGHFIGLEEIPTQYDLWKVTRTDGSLLLIPAVAHFVTKVEQNPPKIFVTNLEKLPNSK